MRRVRSCHNLRDWLIKHAWRSWHSSHLRTRAMVGGDVCYTNCASCASCAACAMPYAQSVPIALFHDNALFHHTVIVTCVTWNVVVSSCMLFFVSFGVLRLTVFVFSLSRVIVYCRYYADVCSVRWRIWRKYDSCAPLSVSSTRDKSIPQKIRFHERTLTSQVYPWRTAIFHRTGAVVPYVERLPSRERVQGISLPVAPVIPTWQLIPLLLLFHLDSRIRIRIAVCNSVHSGWSNAAFFAGPAAYTICHRNA